LARQGATNVKLLGYLDAKSLTQEIESASLIAVPSICYENNPRIVIEAFASQKPVVGARIGGIPELVRDGQTGETFEAGNKDDLRQKVTDLLDDPHALAEMGKRGRDLVEKEFAPELHYTKLSKIYEDVVARARTVN